MLFGKEIPEQRLEPYHDDRDDWEPVPLSDEEIEELYELFECNESNETLNDIYEEVINYE